MLADTSTLEMGMLFERFASFSSSVPLRSWDQVHSYSSDRSSIMESMMPKDFKTVLSFC